MLNAAAIDMLSVITTYVKADCLHHMIIIDSHSDARFNESCSPAEMKKDTLTISLTREWSRCQTQQMVHSRRPYTLSDHMGTSGVGMNPSSDTNLRRDN